MPKPIINMAERAFFIPPVRAFVFFCVAIAYVHVLQAHDTHTILRYTVTLGKIYLFPKANKPFFYIGFQF